MAKVVIPAGYKTPLPVYETQCAIEFIKKNFQENLCNALNLRRVSAPLFVEEASGLNDNLNGYERPVSFDVPDVGVLLDRIQQRGRVEEMGIRRDFLKGLAGYYASFPQVMQSKYGVECLTIDATGIDIRGREGSERFLDTVSDFLAR